MLRHGRRHAARTCHRGGRGVSRHHRYAGQAKGAAWERVRQQVLIRDRHRCTDCGGVGRFEIHHRQPIHQGGGNDLDNLETLCRACHLAAHGPHRTLAAMAWADCVTELSETR